MSSDSEQEFLAAGIAEDIITALSRYSSLFVIARTSSFTYKGRNTQTKEVGRELGVRYILEGSLRKSGSRVRVNAQLVEAETDNHVWARRYDRDVADLFAVQDEISEAVTIAIEPAIALAEQQRAIRKRPENLSAWEAYQRGLWYLGNDSPEGTLLAQNWFAQAINLDSSFAGGYKGLAIATVIAAVDFQLTDLHEALETGERLSREAIFRDATDAETHAIFSDVLRLRGEIAMAITEAENALAICPNLAMAHRGRGAALIFSGQRLEGIAALQTSMRLEPHGVSIPAVLNWMTLAFYLSGE